MESVETQQMQTQRFARASVRIFRFPFTSGAQTFPLLQKKGILDWKECARTERYAFLEEVRSSLPSAVIATAHNATDHLETVLFHLARGTGAQRTLRDFPAAGRKNHPPPFVLHSGGNPAPFAAVEQIPYVTDLTNDDTAYTRNHIRKNILPALRQINPKCEKAALRMSQLLAEDLAYLRILPIHC